MASSLFDIATLPTMILAEKYTDGPYKSTTGKMMDRFRPVDRTRKDVIAKKLDRKARQKAKTLRRSKQRAFFNEHAEVVTEKPSNKAEAIAIENAIAELFDYHFGCDCGPHNYRLAPVVIGYGMEDNGELYPKYEEGDVPCSLCYACEMRLLRDGTLLPYTEVSEMVRIELPSGSSFMLGVTLDPPPLRQKSIEAAEAYVKERRWW